MITLKNASIKKTAFIIYKPKYYIELIKLFLKTTDMPIYIISDSNDADKDGVPDLTDQAAPVKPIMRPFLMLWLAKEEFF